MSESKEEVKGETVRQIADEMSGLNPLEEKRLRVLTDFLRKEVELEKKFTEKNNQSKEEQESDEEEDEEEEEEEEESSEEEIVVKVPKKKIKKVEKVEKTPLKRRPIERMVEKVGKRVTKKLSSRAAQGLAEVGKKLFTFV